MRILLAFLTMSLLLVSLRARAEGGCPPGQVPQQGNGWRACVPNNTSNAAQGPSDTFVGPMAVASWISLSADPDKGVLGESADARTKADADHTAMADCAAKGGLNCRVVVSAKNGCVAMAVSSDIFATASGPTQGTANASAVENCKRGKDPACPIIYSKCVKPVYQ